MAHLTFQVVEGLESGRIFRNLKTPLTIGREDDNDIQLNDERISRFHAKVQEDGGRVILTDLESTNGTRVNGHPVRLRILRAGDLIMLGRCVLLLGGPEEMEQLKARLRELDEAAHPELESHTQSSSTGSAASDLNLAFPQGIPPVPSQLTPLQRAELIDLLEYFRTELLTYTSRPTEELRTDDGEFMRVERDVWNGIKAVLPEFCKILNQLTNTEDKTNA